MAFDVTVVSALQQAMVAGSVVSDGYAVTKAFDRKLAREGEACRKQGLAFIPVAADTLGEAFHLEMLVVAEQSQKVMVRRQLSRRCCCKPRNPKMGYHLGSQDLACHLSGLPSLHPANLTSETQFICYGEANQKLMLPPVHFLPPQSGFFVKL